MSANVYSVENLLVGKIYRSKTIEGEIVNAEKHPNAVWYEGCESYLVEIRPTNSLKNTFRTLAVSNQKGKIIMTYPIRIETFSGEVSTINLPSAGAVAQFISTYPAKLPKGISVKISCDLLGIRGTLKGEAAL